MDARRADFERLALPLRNDLYFAALAFTRREADALDLLQDTLLKAWRGFESFNRGDNIKAWLFTILRNAHLDRCRRKGMEPLVIDPEFDPPAETTLAAMEETLPDDLLAALRSLTPAHQVVILLRDIEGLSYKEIAAALDCPIGSVMSGLHNARARLRAMLGARLQG